MNSRFLGDNFSSSNTFIFSLTDNNNETSNVFSNIFSVFFDNILENDRFNEAVENSMATYNEELFKKKDEKVIHTPSVVYETLDTKINLCFICREDFDPKDWVYPLSCQHIFHKHCLDEAVAHQHYKCCQCNKDLDIRPKKQEIVNEIGHSISYSD